MMRRTQCIKTGERFSSASVGLPRPTHRCLGGCLAIFARLERWQNFTTAVAVAWGMLLPVGSSSAQPQVLLGWEFATPGEIGGWKQNDYVADVEVADGVLRFRTAEQVPERAAPFLISPLFEIPARPGQCIEVRIKTDRDGVVRFYWTETLEGKHGAFSEEKRCWFQASGDGNWHTYRMQTLSHIEASKVIRLRFDTYASAQFEVDYIRVVELSPGKPVQKTRWDFEKDTEDWWAFDPIDELKAGNGKLMIRTAKNPSARVFAPSIDISTECRPWVSLRMKVGKGRQGAVIWGAREMVGLQTCPFPIRADGEFHTYNVDVAMFYGSRNSSTSTWKGTLQALGLRPTDAAEAQVEIDYFGVFEEPAGLADLEVPLNQQEIGRAHV